MDIVRWNNGGEKSDIWALRLGPTHYELEVSHFAMHVDAGAVFDCTLDDLRRRVAVYLAEGVLTIPAWVIPKINGLAEKQLQYEDVEREILISEDTDQNEWLTELNAKYVTGFAGEEAVVADLLREAIFAAKRLRMSPASLRVAFLKMLDVECCADQEPGFAEGFGSL